MNIKRRIISILLVVVLLVSSLPVYSHAVSKPGEDAFLQLKQIAIENGEFEDGYYDYADLNSVRDVSRFGLATVLISYSSVTDKIRLGLIKINSKDPVDYEVTYFIIPHNLEMPYDAGQMTENEKESSYYYTSIDSSFYSNSYCVLKNDQGNTASADFCDEFVSRISAILSYIQKGYFSNTDHSIADLGFSEAMGEYLSKQNEGNDEDKPKEAEAFTYLKNRIINEGELWEGGVEYLLKTYWPSKNNGVYLFLTYIIGTNSIILTLQPPSGQVPFYLCHIKIPSDLQMPYEVFYYYSSDGKYQTYRAFSSVDSTFTSTSKLSLTEGNPDHWKIIQNHCELTVDLILEITQFCYFEGSDYSLRDLGFTAYANEHHYGTEQVSPFKDVNENAYYYKPVMWAVKHSPQITNGTGKDTFSPEQTCTRAQVVTFLWRSAGCPQPTSSNNPFKDVSKDAYYRDAVLWAVERGITNGTSKSTFSPEDPCTRAHVVTFLWRSEGRQKSGSSNPFNDVSSGQYYTDAVLWAVNHNPQITNGTSVTTFSPNAPCTRGQIVTFLYRCKG